jgi:hypothetical protein
MTAILSSLAVLTLSALVAAATDAGARNYQAPTFADYCGSSAWDGFKAGLGL